MLESATVATVAKPRPPGKPLVAGLAIPLALCLVAVVAVAPVVLNAQAETRGVALPVFAVGIVLLFGLGMSDLVRARDSLFARGVVAAGLLWTLSALAASTTPTVYSLGRISEWLVDVALVYLLLSYPSGRVTASSDRMLVAAVALIAALLYLPSVLVATHLPAPSVWSTCDSDCPRNAFALVHSTPWFVRI